MVSDAITAVSTFAIAVLAFLQWGTYKTQLANLREEQDRAKAQDLAEGSLLALLVRRSLLESHGALSEPSPNPKPMEWFLSMSRGFGVVEGQLREAQRHFVAAGKGEAVTGAIEAFFEAADQVNALTLDSNDPRAINKPAERLVAEGNAREAIRKALVKLEDGVGLKATTTISRAI